MSAFRSLKPAASMRTHLLAAALLWTLVGAGLAGAGVFWILGSSSPLRYAVLLFSAGLALLKSRLILDRAARGLVRRVEERGDGRCIGGFLSLRSWGLVVGMALFGRLLRASPLPPVLRGGIYAAIGLALALAARRLWVAWRRSRGSRGS